MAAISAQILDIVGLVSASIEQHAPTPDELYAPGPLTDVLSWDKSQRESYLINHRKAVAYGYATRSNQLLRSFGTLYAADQAAGARSIARSCIEHFAGAVVVVFGEDVDVRKLNESSDLWAHFHASKALTLDKQAGGWMPKQLFAAMRRAIDDMEPAVQAVLISPSAVDDLIWLHGVLSFLEGHADLRLALLSKSIIDGRPAIGSSPCRFAASAAVLSTLRCAAIGHLRGGHNPSELLNQIVSFADNWPIDEGRSDLPLIFAEATDPDPLNGSSG